MQTRFSGKKLGISICWLLLITGSAALAEDKLWSDPATWGGTLPDAGTSVHVPAEDTIIVDVPEVSVKNLRVMGKLKFTDQATRLKTSWIMVAGDKARLEIGTSAQPIKSKIEITLNGPVVADADVHGMGNRFIAAMTGGEIEIHGSSRDKTNWTQLSQHALAGANSLKLSSSVNWERGDKIVIASSSLDPREAEVLEVTGISVDGKTVDFTPALKYDHFGKTLRYGGKPVDMRAEVGLLTRNIVIQGDELSDEYRVGGHIMIMNRDMVRDSVYSRPDYNGKISSARIEGVELRRMGQMTRKGRYSMHWHFVDQGQGQYFRNSSVHNSFQRAVNVHGTDNVLVENNVAYDVFSHIYVSAEDGDEIRNKFYNNLGILAKVLEDYEYSFGRPKSANSDNIESTQDENRPAVFWGKNHFNEFVGNHAAGAWYGMGFHYAGYPYRMNGRLRDIVKAEGLSNICTFRDNVAHSLYTNRTDNLAFYGTATRGWGLFVRAVHGGKINANCELNGLTVYKAQVGGAWLEEDNRLVDAVVTDSNTGTFLSDNAKIHDAVFVGQTENTFGTTKFEPALKGKGGKIYSDTVDFSKPVKSHGGVLSINGIKGIDDGSSISKVSFINLPAGFWVIRDSAGSSVDMSQISCTDTFYCMVFGPHKATGRMQVRDVDGSVTGTPGTILTTNSPQANYVESMLPANGDKGFEWISEVWPSEDSSSQTDTSLAPTPTPKTPGEPKEEPTPETYETQARNLIQSINALVKTVLTEPNTETGEELFVKIDTLELLLGNAELKTVFHGTLAKRARRLERVLKSYLNKPTRKANYKRLAYAKRQFTRAADRKPTKRKRDRSRRRSRR